MNSWSGIILLMGNLALIELKTAKRGIAPAIVALYRITSYG
jgi:hypothetical protein